jgi:hypothetical protein
MIGFKDKKMIRKTDRKKIRKDLIERKILLKKD